MTDSTYRLIVALPTLVFMWEAIGAARTFSTKDRPVGAGGLISFAFIGLMIADKPVPLDPTLVVIGCALLLASITLFEWARFSIRGRFFSYIFASDTPAFLHTSGPYAYIRNPFYASYILAMIAASVMFEGWYRWLIVIAAIVYFSIAARFEEGKFAKSDVAAQYEEYKRRTGRFIPRRPSARPRP